MTAAVFSNEHQITRQNLSTLPANESACRHNLEAYSMNGILARHPVERLAFMLAVMKTLSKTEAYTFRIR